ncbi:MAG: sulfite exporter TauE/SafE family protein [Desulfonauticus sp.]|nr:sulfite exporter TauE/SafE family protein [Desulfonauticus sp.]
MSFDFLIYTFPVSGVTTNLLYPPFIMFVISLFTSTAGVSGAFALLPLQISVFGYTSPGVSATNFVYNIVAIPAGVIKYIKDRLLSKSLLILLIVGTTPGIFLGYYIRVIYLLDPAKFKIFVGCVLLYLGARVFQSGLVEYRKRIFVSLQKSTCSAIQQERMGFLKTTIFLDSGEKVSFSNVTVFIPAFISGIIGGAYGIGGGAIMSPFCIAVLGLPVYVVAGATLASTWTSSLISVLIYAFGPLVGHNLQTSPDWQLGLLFGLGGMGGIYIGARLQKIIRPFIIKVILGLVVLSVALKYLVFSLI